MRMLAAAVALFSAAAAPVLAQQGPRAMTPEQRAARFEAIDANKDGSREKTLWLASIPAMMHERVTDEQLEQMWARRLDADGAGRVTKEQSVNMQPMRPGPP